MDEAWSLQAFGLVAAWPRPIILLFLLTTGYQEHCPGTATVLTRVVVAQGFQQVSAIDNSFYMQSTAHFNHLSKYLVGRAGTFQKLPPPLPVLRISQIGLKTISPTLFSVFSS